MKEKLDAYIQLTGLFLIYEISLIKHGHNHDVFLVKSDGEKYIAHVSKDVRDSGSDLLNTYRALSFLEDRGVSFVSKVVAHNKDTSILIETFIGEEDVVFSELNRKQLDMLVKMFVTVHSFSVVEYQAFCEECNIISPRVQAPLESLHVYGEQRFEIVKELCPDEEVKEWIGPKLSENIANARCLTEDHQAGLRMGDIGGNIRITDDNLFLIDWEFSTLGYGHELAYIKIHSHPTSEQFEYIVDRYSCHSGIPLGVLYEEIDMEERVTRVNDVIWAAMKWGQSETSLEEVEKYKKLTFDRMKLYEKL